MYRFVKATYDNLELAIHSNDDDFKIDGITKGDKKSQNVLDAKSSKSINDILVKKKVLPKPLEKPVFNKVIFIIKICFYKYSLVNSFFFCLQLMLDKTHSRL